MRGILGKKAVAITLGLALAAGIGTTALAQGPVRPEKTGGGYEWYCPPPRFQIFHAPGQYGGMMMMDTKTGETYQRIIVATPDGIDIRWLKLERHKKLKTGETIQW